MSIARSLHAAILVAALAFTNFSAQAATDCRVVFDAGSSGTRLYVFEKQGNAWVDHEGPKVSALADPVRQIRGKTWNDADAVVAEVVGTLDAIKKDGAKWKGFDWGNTCTLRSASVYATAGMRIAEQESADRASRLWSKLKVALQAKLGPGVAVQAKTLTGFEEGLFAWLTLNQIGKGTDFGLVEMGGASAQVTFPCATCADAKPVEVGGRTLPFFSYSYLGLGNDEAPNTVGATVAATACALDAAKSPADKSRQCADALRLTGAQGMFDPYNLASGKGKGAEKAIPKEAAAITTWYSTGAFSKFKASDVQTCCASGNTCFEPGKACFRSVYFQKFHDSVGVKNPQPSNTNWTLGAVACDETRCLKTPAKDCNWLPGQCLAN